MFYWTTSTVIYIYIFSIQPQVFQSSGNIPLAPLDLQSKCAIYNSVWAQPLPPNLVLLIICPLLVGFLQQVPRLIVCTTCTVNLKAMKPDSERLRVWKWFHSIATPMNWLQQRKVNMVACWPRHSLRAMVWSSLVMKSFPLSFALRKRKGHSSWTLGKRSCPFAFFFFSPLLLFAWSFALSHPLWLAHACLYDTVDLKTQMEHNMVIVFPKRLQ